MTRFFLRGLSSISRYFNLDILWRIIRNLSLVDRRSLAWRLLQSEAEQVSFRREGTLWTGNTNDSAIMTPLFGLGYFQGQNIQAMLRRMNQEGRLTSSRKVILGYWRQHRYNFVESADLIQNGAAAPIRPVDELPELVECLQRVEYGLTDVLLLAKQSL